MNEMVILFVCLIGKYYKSMYDYVYYIVKYWKKVKILVFDYLNEKDDDVKQWTSSLVKLNVEKEVYLLEKQDRDRQYCYCGEVFVEFEGFLQKNYKG